MMGNYHVRCGAGEKPEVLAPEAYLSLFGEVPEFPSKLSTMRKYNISSTIVLQDISQIEAMYQDNWKNLAGNCSTYIFLGTQEPNTLKYFSDMLGKKTIRARSNSISKGTRGNSSNSFQNTGREVLSADELGRLPANECVVFTQNMRPVRDKKYEYTKHPMYKYTADADNNAGFRYNTMSVYNNTKPANIKNILKARADGERLKGLVGNQKRKGGVTDFSNTDKVKVNGELNQAADRFTADEKAEARAYNDCLNECIEKAVQYCSQPACIMKLSAVPVRYLYKLVSQVSGMLGNRAVLIFSDVENPKKSAPAIVGVAMDPEHIGLHDAMKNNTYTMNCVDEKLFTIVAIRKTVYEKYRNMVLEQLGWKNEEEDLKIPDINLGTNDLKIESPNDTGSTTDTASASDTPIAADWDSLEGFV